MQTSTFKKRDLNRYRKVYPYIRRKPVTTFISENETVMEVGSVTFSDANTGEHVFKENFGSAPYVTAISIDTESNNQADVNIFVRSVSTSSVIFESSQTFTGKIHFHAIVISC